MTLTKTALLAIGAATLALNGAEAADLDGLPTLYDAPIVEVAPELTPVEIGNGWYLRGDVSWQARTDLDGKAEFRSTPFSSSQSFDGTSLDDTAGIQIGAGYRFTNYLRADVTAGYSRPNVNGDADFPGLCGVGCDARFSAADARSWELMANAYVDLGTFAGFTPYVGAGAGAVQLKYDDTTLRVCDTGLAVCVDSSAKGGDSWRFAYSLMAGVAYDVTRNVSVDIGYRYMDVDGGDAFTSQNEAYRTKDDGFDSHTVRVGLRYALW